MADITVNIDFAKLHEIADLGIRRASVFMGIATNVARIDPPVSHVLDDKTQFIVMPSEISEANRRLLIDEFENWNIGNAFREIVETFSLFLLEAYGIIHIVETNSLASLERAKRRFSFKGGVSDHLQIVCDMVGVENRFGPMFVAMNQARNCIAHRRGIVGMADILEPDRPFNLCWRTRGFVLEDGRDVGLALQRGEEVYVAKEQALVSMEVERSKLFSLGQQIRLNRHELSEICFGFMIATQVVGQGLVAYIRAKGIRVPEEETAKFLNESGASLPDPSKGT
ncbi:MULTISPECIES: hypothetical protein [unclassified Mesorhizobium]|uniref:hypothetical protein n=1 Tax=unclassified Mesorhizobium TaxID=325217 RepID=UPI001CCEEF1D|nr:MULTISPECIES: hypothetical protein [unclassified Mesorhizobium]MBZ9680998.1 hypothetical protein [Mesorhizobium sp. CO1-1-2]MBZ9927096.1 hypothetical protein [Mesorhizobium sp. BR1-1-4]